VTDDAPTPVRRARSRGPVVFAVAAVAVMFVGVFPTQTYFSQRAAIARAEQQLGVLSEQNDRLEDRIDDLNSRAEIERIAREQFEMILPGERPYVMVPPGEAPLVVPRAWPFTGLAQTLSRPGG
jgi:cell division protein FtsB